MFKKPFTAQSLVLRPAVEGASIEDRAVLGLSVSDDGKHFKPIKTSFRSFAFDIRFTRKKDVIYAFLMNPADDKVLIRTLGKKARLADGAPQAVRLLGYEGMLNWSQEEDGLKVQLPEAWVGRMIPVLEIRGFAAWDGDIRPGLDGQLVLTANRARLNGDKLRQVFGRDFIEGYRAAVSPLIPDSRIFLRASSRLSVFAPAGQIRPAQDAPDGRRGPQGSP